MNRMSLSNKLLLATGLIFIAFFISSIFVFYKGQTRLTIQEMDHSALAETALRNFQQKTTLPEVKAYIEHELNPKAAD